MDYNEQALKLHKKYRGKIKISPKFKLKKEDLSWTYTPGVAAVSKLLAENPEETTNYTFKGNSVAVISDGSAVLGLGNIGPYGAYPVMEGKAMLFKHFADIDSVPIVLNTQDPDEIIKIVEAIAPSFGGINLEDIAAPQCFYIEETLKARLDIPVVHDDQWGTAVVTLAGLINAIKVTNKSAESVKIVMSGAGAAGTAIAKILTIYGFKNIVMTDSKGIITSKRDNLSAHKESLVELTNCNLPIGTLGDALKGTDIFIGVSLAGLLKEEMVETMNKDAIIFALANPIPEIMPDLAKSAGALIVATGRSDFANQVNNALVFPGIFRGAFDNNVRQVTIDMQVNAATKLAALVTNPTSDNIIPGIFDDGVLEAVASSIV